jgi:hypothetical protein
MDVHAHTHTARKKWTHYFWEFFMLFLAVTLGFFVENQREHFIEHLREKQYVKSLIEDLEKDTADLNNDIPFWDLQMQRIDTIRNEIDKSPENRNKLMLYLYSGYMRWYDKFVYHDRTIMQLKNGGNFRLIRNKAVAESLIDYDASINSELRDMEALSNTIWLQLNFLQNKIFNTRDYSPPNRYIRLDSAIRTDPKPIEIKKEKEEELFEYYNLLDYFRGLNIVRNRKNKSLLNQAINLMSLIKKEYHLK